MLENNNEDEKQKELNRTRKIKNLESRMCSLCNKDMLGFDMDFKPWEKWKYTFSKGKNLLTYVENDLAEKTDREVISEVLHNLWHALYSTPPSLKWVKEPLRYFVQIASMLEDKRVEQNLMQKYAGTYDNFLFKFEKEDSQISGQVENQLPKFMQYMYNINRVYWDKEDIKADDDVKKALEETIEDVFELLTAKNTQDLVQNLYASNVWNTLIKFYEDNDDKGNWEWDWEWDWESKELQDKINEATSIKDIMDKMKEMSWNPQEDSWDWEKDEKQNFWEDVEQKYDEKEQKSQGQEWNEDACNFKYGQNDPILSKNTPKPHTEARTVIESYEWLYQHIYPVLPFFKKKLGSILKDNKIERQGGYFKSWKLNSNSLYRWKCNNYKLFTKKLRKLHKDYAVTLLIDESWSMSSNNKDLNAARSTTLLAEVLTHAQIPFEIIWFNCETRVYKKLNEKFSWKHRRQIERIVIETGTNNALGNNDWYAVNYATHRLRKYTTKGTERILIVISDWLPAPRWELSSAEQLRTQREDYEDFDLKEEIAVAEKDSIVIWVGVGAKHVRDYYRYNAVVNEISELPTQILQQLKKQIRRG